MIFFGVSLNKSKLIGKITFARFFVLQLDGISHGTSFAYQHGGLHIVSFATLNANVFKTRTDNDKQSTAFFPISSELSSEINMICGVNFPFKYYIHGMFDLERLHCIKYSYLEGIFLFALLNQAQQILV